MITVWKTPVTEPVQKVMVPDYAQPVAAQLQHGNPAVWWKVDTDQPERERTIYVFGTGHPIPTDRYLRYVDSLQMDGGTLVWHVFVDDDEEPF